MAVFSVLSIIKHPMKAQLPHILTKVHWSAYIINIATADLDTQSFVIVCMLELTQLVLLAYHAEIISLLVP